MKRIITVIITSLFIIIYLPLTFAQANNKLTTCNFNDADNSITLKCLQNYQYKIMTLNNPERLVVDLDEVSLNTKLSGQENQFFTSVRSSDHDHFLRLVFDLKEKLKFNSHFDSQEHALKISLKTTETSATKLSENNESSLPPPPKNNFDKTEKKETTAVNAAKDITEKPTLKDDEDVRGKNIVVVIDPGHGGKDPGAAGLNGAREKDVVLQISKELYALLKQEPGFTPVLTRDHDFYIPLRKRLAIARKNHADIFIAIHADAYHHSLAAGASVFALSQRGATSEAAKWLAEKENESELGGLGSELADKDEMLRSVLIDLSQTHTIEESLQFGQNLLKHLAVMSRLHHPRVEQAAFVVLKSPDIPSVLVETGFLSNPLEEEKLTDPNYQHRTAQAISDGIKQYFTTHSLKGTWFAANRRKKDAD